MSHPFPPSAALAAVAFNQKNWNDAFDHWVRPSIQLILAVAVALAVLISVSGLLTRWMVLRDSPAWGAKLRRSWALAGALAVLAAATFLPLQAIARPFVDSSWLTACFCGSLWWTGLLIWCGLARRPRVMPIPTALVLAALWSTLASGFFWWGGPAHRLLVAYLALTLLGVGTVATAWGQNLRLQVEARGADGTVDAAAADYVLARLQITGQGKTNGLDVSRPTDLTNLLTADISAIPVGALAATVARIMYAIRPGLTWRARVTMVDPDRCVVTINRNGLNVENVVISRLDLGLGELPAGLVSPQLEEERSRARAQLLTGASAVVLVRLSRIHPQLRPELCGAGQWRGLALQMIAVEPALVGDAPTRLRLLRESVNLEPGYGRGRLAYLSELFTQAPPVAGTRERFALWMDDLAWRATRRGAGWEVVRMQALSSSALMRFHCCLAQLPAG